MNARRFYYGFPREARMKKALIFDPNSSKKSESQHKWYDRVATEHSLYIEFLTGPLKRTQIMQLDFPDYFEYV
jgi:hypothetical protein